MSFLDTLRTLPGGHQPRKRKLLAQSQVLDFLATHRLVTTIILLVTVVSIVLISFVGVDSASLPVFPNQISTVKVTASVPFDYQSEYKSNLSRENIRNRVPRVYRLDNEHFRKFEVDIRSLLADLESYEKKYLTPENPSTEDAQAAAGKSTAETSTQSVDSAKATEDQATAQAAPPESTTAERKTVLNAITNRFNESGPYHASLESVQALLQSGDAKARTGLVENALLFLREIYQSGIQDSTLAGMGSSDSEGTKTLTIFKILRPGGDIAEHAGVRTMEAARTDLRVDLAIANLGLRRTHAIARLFDNGLAPNLYFDQEATTRLQDQAVADLPPAVVHVASGQTIIENGVRVTPEQYEMFEAYRNYLLEHDTANHSDDLQFLRRILLVLAMILASTIYIRIEDQETIKSNGRLALLALVVIFNLALVRATYWLGDLPYFVHHSAAAATLPYLAPTAIAPIIVAILLNAGSAIFMALLISLFTSVIYGNRLDVLVLTFFASIVAIYFCQHVRKRSSIVRAALYAGTAVAAFALCFGLIDQQPFLGPDFTVPRQILTGLLNGLITGVIVVGFLPIIEGLFNRTTDITLLELTDFNHPLLRRMQMEAPGTYNHSLTVAQLAENASSAIGANPLLARVCALFHDIGKINKPGYFTENQRDRANPHDENNPSLSALIIKAHVKDGVDLAIKHKLPRAVIDVIQQHHGTSLIRFFYQRALGSKRQAQPAAGTTPPITGSRAPITNTGPGLENVVCETTYRYDGPRPRFKESAIIHLADGVEAASRSMRKVTPQHVGELIDQIFRDRIEDGQLEEAPLTLEDLTKIKSSFTLTLLNALHSRVSYGPIGESEPAEKKVQPEPTTESARS